MSLTTSEMTPADIRACTGGNDNGGMWGGDWLAYILLFALLGGGGFGGFGGGGILPWLLFANNGFGGGCGGSPCATQADVRAAVDQQTLISKLDNAVYGLTDSTYALNNTINQNFRGVDNAICTLGYQGAQHANALSAQLADCCCKIEGGIERSTTQGILNTNLLDRRISDCCCDLENMNMHKRFDAQAYNCNTLQAIDKLGDRIIDYMAAEKTQALRDENQALRLAASQAKQNQYLINELRPCPVPAYITCNPYAASYGFTSNNGCGCGGSF